MSSALHPDGKLKPHDSVSNPSTKDNIHSLIEARMLTRRSFIKGSVAVTAAAAVSGSLLSGMPLDAFANKGKGKPHKDEPEVNASPVIGFNSVSPNILPMTDAVTVPAGYTARVLV